MPVRRAEPVGWAGARSPTSEDGREGREGAVDSLEIDQREGLGVWQRSRRATRSTDPGRSAWWLVLRIIGAVLGGITPFIIKLGTPWSILGSLAGGLLSQAVISALQDWVSRRAKDRQAAESSEIYDSLVDKELEELKVHHSDRDVSEFLPRDAQKKLIQNIEDRTPTLIIGPSMSGKTRLVVETVRKNYPSTPVCFPKDVMTYSASSTPLRAGGSSRSSYLMISIDSYPIKHCRSGNSMYGFERPALSLPR